MDKEKLKKEAEQYINGKQKPLTKYDLIAFVEPREKQIQIDAEQIRALQKQNGELTDKVKELEALRDNLVSENMDLSKTYQDDVTYLKNKMSKLEAQLEREKNLNQCMTDNNEQLREQIEKMKCCANCMYEPPFDKHCDKCIQGTIKLRYRNWKLRETK